MSWETALTYTIHFNRKTYDTKWAVEDDLGEVKAIIANHRQQLFSLAMMTEPHKLLQAEDSDYMTLIQVTVNRLLDDLEEFIAERNDLQTLLDEWDNCHTEDGKPITPPAGIGDAYIWGDFINDGSNNINEV